MKNILGKEEGLDLFNVDGVRVYKFTKYSYGYWDERTYDSNGNLLTCKKSDGYWDEHTYDSNGNRLTFKNSYGYWWERKFNDNGNVLTFKDSNSYWSERTCDDNGNELTFKDSDGVTRGFDKEYTMEELIEKIGHNFKIKK